MQLEESFDLPVPRDAAWSAFKDVAMLVSCLPGAKLASAPDADPLQIVFSVKLGPINASFAGQGTVVYDDDCSGSFTGGGADRGTNSRVKGDAKFSLHETDAGTRVQIVVDYALSGALAQFGRPGIVKEIAAKLTQHFAANLRARLTEANESSIATADRFDAGGVLASAVRGRVKRMFGGRDE